MSRLLRASTKRVKKRKLSITADSRLGKIVKLAMSQGTKSVQPHMQLYRVGLEAAESRMLLKDCSVNPEPK